MKTLVLIITAFLAAGLGGWALQADEPTIEPAVPPDSQLSTLNSQLEILPLWREILSGKRPMRIGLARSAEKITLSCEGPFKVFVDGVFFRDAAEGESITFSGEMKEWVALVPEGNEAWSIRLDGRPFSGRYPGKMEIYSAGSGEAARLTLVNEVPLPEYVAGVIEKEMPASFCLEALRAQAIAARSYALSYLGRHAEEGFDLCAETHCQVYRGLPDPFAPAVSAAFSTRGQIITFQGQPVRTFYHSTCGGETADGLFLSENSTGLPYLAGAPDAQSRQPLSGEEAISRFLSENSSGYCSISPKYRWRVSFTAEEMNALIQANLGGAIGIPGLNAGKVKSLRIASRRGARVKTLEVECESGTYSVQGNSIRWLFCGDSGTSSSRLLSTLFTLSMEKDGAGSPKRYNFTGGGWGHGVGMCQWGAEGRARVGASASDILSAYFPGTELWTEEIQ
jgi:SpoIID/LytB domain protein